MGITVSSCGHIGPKLTRTPVADGHDVRGVRRSDDGLDAVEVTGAEAVHADVIDADSLGAVPDVDHVASVASSGGRGADAARAVSIEGLRTAIDQFAVRDSPPERFVYTSSMGVYGDHGSDFADESIPLDPTTDRTRAFAEAEHAAREYVAERGVEGTITRFVGLYGPDCYRLERYPNGLTTAGYLGMVHRDDVAGVIASPLETDYARDDTVLVVDDEPVSKHEFADWLADECGAPCPEKHTKEKRLGAGDFSAAARHRIPMSKRCSNDYLREPGYLFAYPTYREGYRVVTDAYRVDGD